MFGGIFDHQTIDKKIKETELIIASPDFWNDSSNAQKVMNDLKLLKGRVEPWRELISEVDDMKTLYDLGIEGQDQSIELELKPLLDSAREKFEHQSILNLLSGEVDKNGCFLTIHAGAGGTEACDWANMLYRMYTRYALNNGYKSDITCFSIPDKFIEHGHYDIIMKRLELDVESIYNKIKERLDK